MPLVRPRGVAHLADRLLGDPHVPCYTLALWTLALKSLPFLSPSSAGILPFTSSGVSFTEVTADDFSMYFRWLYFLYDILLFVYYLTFQPRSNLSLHRVI
jgi:hypothetical protein